MFLKNAWYVAVWNSGITHDPHQVMVHGYPIDTKYNLVCIWMGYPIHASTIDITHFDNMLDPTHVAPVHFRKKWDKLIIHRK